MVILVHTLNWSHSSVFSGYMAFIELSSEFVSIFYNTALQMMADYNALPLNKCTCYYFFLTQSSASLLLGNRNFFHISGACGVVLGLQRKDVTKSKIVERSLENISGNYNLSLVRRCNKSHFAIWLCVLQIIISSHSKANFVVVFLHIKLNPISFSANKRPLTAKGFVG